ncbi:hypothetical protein, partial [uncultured Thiodictyon sp.]|uniref:hypothetical protein n=1 Tax=uncultured Thiodictyon sp. TaxID=1846217 RepID=UPI0025F6851F
VIVVGFFDNDNDNDNDNDSGPGISVTTSVLIAPCAAAAGRQSGRRGQGCGRDARVRGKFRPRGPGGSIGTTIQAHSG